MNQDHSPTSTQISRTGKWRWFANNLGARLLLLICFSFVVGMLSIIVFYAAHQKQSILEQNERAMALLTESVTSAIESVMLSGYVDTALDMSERLIAVPGVVNFYILRTDGSVAFQDNGTIEAVNRFLGGDGGFPPPGR